MHHLLPLHLILLLKGGETQTVQQRYRNANGDWLYQNTSLLTHRLTANHHDHWILFRSIKPSGLSLQPPQQQLNRAWKWSTDLSLLPLSLSFWWGVLLNGNGAVSQWLNLDSGLGPPCLTEMSQWSYRSLYLWHPGALRGIRLRRWQYHGEGHTGRRKKKTSFSHWESYSWTCNPSVFAHPPAFNTHPLFWQSCDRQRTHLAADVNTISSGCSDSLVTGSDTRRPLWSVNALTQAHSHFSIKVALAFLLLRAE